MKKYNFSLQTVLSLREDLVKEWEVRLGKANGEVQIVLNRIESLQAQLHSSRLEQISDIRYLQVKSIFEDRLKFQINKEEELLKEKESERDKIKEVYLEKSRDKKVIEKLKEKSLKKYKKELNKDDILFIDELNNASKLREEMLGGIN